MHNSLRVPSPVHVQSYALVKCTLHSHTTFSYVLWCQKRDVFSISYKTITTVWSTGLQKPENCPTRQITAEFNPSSTSITRAREGCSGPHTGKIHAVKESPSKLPWLIRVSLLIKMSAVSEFREGRMVQTIYLSPPFSLPSQPRPPRKCLTTEVEHLEENQNTSASRSSRRRSSKVGKHRILVSQPKLTVTLAELGFT